MTCIEYDMQGRTIRINDLQSCEAIRERYAHQKSDVYSVYLGNPPTEIRVYCDMTDDGGGWTVSKNTMIRACVTPAQALCMVSTIPLPFCRCRFAVSLRKFRKHYVRIRTYVAYVKKPLRRCHCHLPLRRNRRSVPIGSNPIFAVLP